MNKLTKTFLISTALLATAGTAVAIAGSGHANKDHGHSAGMSHGMGSGQHMKEKMELSNQNPDLTAEQRQELAQDQQHKQGHHAMTNAFK